MKYSRQRELVRTAVEQSECHPTADAVYQQVRKAEPNISLATVYRNLNQLSDHHIIRRITVPGDSDHFDRTVTPHEHLVCTCCKRVVDIFPDQPLLTYFQSVSPSVRAYDLVLYGLCEQCSKQK